nr:TlyA family RNA methyltransferase [Negativicutes bacterium]
MKKERLDLLLVEQGHFSSRERAKATIMAGKVLVNEVKIEKAGTMVPADGTIRILGEIHPFVSRGGLKLQKGLVEFNILLDGLVMADIGASTGGFSDCALQAGARKVYAIDVGYGQLDWKIRQDPRVVVWERTNIRNVTKESFGDPIDFVGIDVSFISLSLVLPVVKAFLDSAGKVICLIKPQFEAGKERVGKNGVVRDPKVHQAVLTEVLRKIVEIGFSIQGLSFSPIRGPEGNIEFLAYLDLSGISSFSLEDQVIQNLV